MPIPGLCQRHQTERHKLHNASRALIADPIDRGYHTARWQRLRASVLAESPLCVHCQAENRVALANVVDHIVPVKQGGPMWDASNLQPLCNLHHELKSEAEGSRFGRRRRA